MCSDASPNANFLQMFGFLFAKLFPKSLCLQPKQRIGDFQLFINDLQFCFLPPDSLFLSLAFI